MSLSRGSKPFGFEAPDESFGPSLIKEGGLEIGPALNFEGSRTAEDVGADLDKVPFTFEAGAFVQYAFSPKFRIRAEGRKGLGGHDGWTGQVGADFVARDGDDWLFSIGPPGHLVGRPLSPRLFRGDSPPNRPAPASPLFAPAAESRRSAPPPASSSSSTRRWGIYSYAKYDRLVGDAARFAGGPGASARATSFPAAWR